MAGLETVYAIHHFEAENPDEIAFAVGEPIIVLEKDDGYNDGWWQVSRLDKRSATISCIDSSITGTQCQRRDRLVSYELHFVTTTQTVKDTIDR